MATITGRSRSAEANSQDLLLLRISQRYERAISREIARSMNHYANNIDSPMIDVVVSQNHQRNLISILTRLWNESGHAFSQNLLNVRKNLIDFEKKEIDISVDVVDAAVANWIKIYGSPKITQIDRTTQQDIANIVAKGVEDGATEKEIAKLIKLAAPIKSASRSQTISRTETHGSGQGVSLEVAKMTDIPMKKIWITSIDERTRGEDDQFNHVAANGQTVGIDEQFTVSGEKLDYPGDPQGSAGNVINCRCVVGYELAD